MNKDSEVNKQHKVQDYFPRKIYYFQEAYFQNLATF